MLSRFSVSLYACLHHGITMHQYVHCSVLHLHCMVFLARFSSSKPAGGQLKHLVLAYLQKVPP